MANEPPPSTVAAPYDALEVDFEEYDEDQDQDPDEND